MVLKTGKRITVFTGHYGSGKTEIAVNFALHEKEEHEKTTLIDLDFVNPYFRSREAREFLNRQGINVIASAEEYFNTDVPAFSPQIIGALKNKDSRVIVDLGGDEIGARAAGRFRHNIDSDEYELFLVVNPFRPFTSDPADVKLLVNKIEASGRLKVTAVVSNPHLAGDTTLEDVLTGHKKVLEISEFLVLPVKLLTLEESLGTFPEIVNLRIPMLKLKRVMLTPWEQ